MAKLDCLDEWVGITESCDPDVIEGEGYFINNLEGIDLAFAAAGTTSTYQDEIAMLNAVKKRAKGSFLAKLRTSDRFGKLNLGRTILASRTAGIFQENKKTEAASAGNYRGILLDLCDRDYVAIYIDSVEVFVNYSSTDTISIIDLIQGVVLDTIAITTVAGQKVKVQINKLYRVNRQKAQIMIALDAGEGIAFKTQLKNGCSSCSGYKYRDHFIQVSSVQLPTAGSLINSATTTISHTHGLSVDYSVRCDMAPFFCNMAESLAYPFVYWWAAEVVAQVRFSKRLSSFVTLYTQENEDLEERFLATANESLLNVMENIAIPDDKCFQCIPAVSNKVALP